MNSMNTDYYAAIDKMEKANVSREYVVGWASGYLQNPKIEEQRSTEAYEAGYTDGEEKNADNFEAWVGK
jgi:hypothetical protein